MRIKSGYFSNKIFNDNLELLFVLMIVLEVVIGILDYIIGDFATLSLVYVIPVAVTSFKIGKKSGVINAIFSVSVWSLVDYKLHTFNHGLIYVFGELLSRLILVIAFALVISAYANANDKLKELAFKDIKTGALNYRAFLDRVEEKMSLSDRMNLNGYIAYFDMDKFKEVNDQFGHSTGDFVLKQFSQISMNTMRSYDIFARIGGDEFVAFILDKDNNSIEVILDRISSTFAKEMKEQGFEVTVSYGYVLVEGDITNIEKYVHLADLNMYTNKRLLNG